SPSGFKYVSAQEILNQPPPDPKFIIQNLLTPGLTIFAASPKSGKSTLLTYLMAHISRGIGVFWKRPVLKSKVLYLGLEDGIARIHKRLDEYNKNPMVGGSRPLDDLYFVHETEKTGIDFVDQLQGEIIKEGFKVVVVDVLHKIFDPKHNFGYAAQYEIMDALHQCAIDTDSAIIVVHHTNKKASNGLQSISGTQGLTAAADNIMILSRSSDSWAEAYLKLDVQGRDIDSQEIWLEITNDGMEYIELPEAPISPIKSQELSTIIELRKNNLTQTQIATALNISQSTVNRRIKAVKENPKIAELSQEEADQL
ncbi:MAG: AAA family ATPase, partial [Cyclobacteriaceae bacterium]